MYSKVKTFIKSIIRPEKQEIVWKYKFGATIPMPSYYKQKVILDYKKKYDIKNFVETGTYEGEMIKACLDEFEHLFSIELDKTLYENAKIKFKENKKLSLYCGDSGVELKKIISNLEGSTLFWLDAHYSAGITAKGDLDTPIVQELHEIFKINNDKNIILIDDARCFIGEYDYPTLFELKDIINEIAPNYKINVKDDIIRIGKNIEL
tara:strand:- start:3023 stop:3643 length:621 start_codon:yes stop_codon:yes gene_type:complete